MREIGANGHEALIAGKDPDMSVKPAISADLDELDAAQSELAMMRRRLRAAAHEIRTPLAGAATIVDILAASDAAAESTFRTSLTAQARGREKRTP